MSTTTQSAPGAYIIAPDDLILVTGASGFIGSRVVKRLLDLGFRNIRCFARPASSRLSKIDELREGCSNGARVELFPGDLLSKDDCAAAAADVKVIFHLAAGRGEKSFPDAFLNSVVTTRNLLDACLRQQCLERFVNVSSFAVYSNRNKPSRDVLDETCPVEAHPEVRGEAYAFAKTKQDEILAEYGAKYGLPYVIVRPGYVIGPGKQAITGRVGVDTFGIFLHMGGSNTIPFTHVDNCADAIVLAGLKPGVDGEIFNIVDDNLPSSRHFLHLYKRNVRKFKSIYVPHAISHALCNLWERYSIWSEGQLPPAFNSSKWHANWKKTQYSNEKAKSRLGWTPAMSMSDGLAQFFEGCRSEQKRA